MDNAGGAIFQPTTQALARITQEGPNKVSTGEHEYICPTKNKDQSGENGVASKLNSCIIHILTHFSVFVN